MAENVDIWVAGFTCNAHCEGGPGTHQDTIEIAMPQGVSERSSAAGNSFQIAAAREFELCYLQPGFSVRGSSNGSDHFDGFTI